MVITTNTVSSLKGPDPKSLIQAEREGCQFDTTKMNYFLEGTKERAELVQSIIQQIERDPILATSSEYYELDKAQQRELSAKKIDRLSRYLETESSDAFNIRLSLMGLIDPQVSTRVGINLGLFLSCVRGNGTFEQIEYWTHKKGTIQLRNIYGCFGMTELAHGSNVPGLETTATFDKETDEFIVNTPHIGATKWWIGGAAHSSTHCSVYARLIVDGTDYGVKTFVVPLRDTNHDMYPGVTVGDIGAKMGRDGIDNGWIQFSNVRIPRFFMLQKFCKVTREGEVTLPPLEQLAYSALLGGRVSMVLDSYRMTARMTTIALRYAVGRRQFKDKGADAETQIINYPLHQRRLLPYLALSYVISAGAWKLADTIENTLDTLDKAVKTNDIGEIMSSIEDMKSLFVDSGSLKSTCTWLTADVIDECRQSCGGHGYSAYSGFGKAYNDWVVQCTWEGDNNILATSIGKPLINHLISVLEKGKKVKGSLSFLNNAKEYLNDKPVLETLDDLNDTRKVLKAVEVAIIRLGYQASLNLKENSGKFDAIGPDMVSISKLKAHHYLLTEFLDRIDKSEDKEIVPYLQSLGRLYSASIVLQKFSGDFLAYSVIPTKLISVLTSTFIPQLCKEIRPHVISLTDSFQLSDMVVNSSIGNYDGNFYENYFARVKSNNPPSNTKAPYTDVITGMLHRGDVDARERFEKSAEAAESLSK